VGQRFYRIVVEGELSDRLAVAFDGLTMQAARGTTELSGVCIDASALYGVLDRVRDLGLVLLAVESRPVARTP